MSQKVERKYLAHFLDVAFNDSSITVGSVTYNDPVWFRLGKDLEEYGEDLGAQVDVKNNILGEQSVTHTGYQVQSGVSPFYAYDGSGLERVLFDQLAEIANERATGTKLETQKVDMLFHMDSSTGNPVVDWAYKEDVYVVPESIGGDTSGIQIPFNVYALGNRRLQNVTYNSTTKTWTFVDNNSTNKSTTTITSST